MRLNLILSLLILNVVVGIRLRGTNEDYCDKCSKECGHIFHDRFCSKCTDECTINLKSN